MSYSFEPGRLYRMPTHFGPTPGPRQLPEGQHLDLSQNPKRLAINVSFLSDRDALEALLPPDFTVPQDAEPIVTAEIQYLKEIDWLAGRGYNTLGVKFPARYKGKEGNVPGAFLAVLWENLADPILSGRDELGFNKIWCDIPEPVVLAGRHRFSGIWLGYQFFEMELWDLKPGPLSSAGTAPSNPPGSQGMLHFKYVPRTGQPGAVDAAYATLTPLANPNVKIVERFDGQGSFSFRHTSWQDMPTQYNIVTAFAALPLKEFRGASIVRSFGGKDFGDQTIVR